MKKAKTLLLWLSMCWLLVFPAFAETVAQVPNDPYYDQQWALEAIDWLPVWQQGLTGKGVKIGIIDSGAVAGHEDLLEADLQGVSFNNSGVDNSQAYTNDVIGHGTFVTGVIAAQPNNGKGIVGIAPDAEIYVYRAFSDKTGSVNTVLHAIDQAIADECQIINLSMGMPRDTQQLKLGIQKAQQAGILIIAAVGNGNYGLTTILYPAGYEGVIGVGSVNEQLERSSFSQTNESVFVVAPGQNLVGADYSDPTGYVSGSGTSYAAPIVTALAALALDYDPNLTPEEIAEMLRLTAVDLGETGYDTSYGYGLVNAEAFINGFEDCFSVRYQLSAGEISEDIPVFYPAAEGLSQLPVPVREHYNFAGWYADEARTVPVTEIACGTSGIQVLYDKWELDPEAHHCDETGDGDHCCDICGADGMNSCSDINTDHLCDECQAQLSTHFDASNDHMCDHCGETLSECSDSEDADTLCDLCGKDLLQIKIQDNCLVVDNQSDTVLILAEYGINGRLLTAQILTANGEWVITGHTKMFILSGTSIPRLPYLELKQESITATE